MREESVPEIASSAERPAQTGTAAGNSLQALGRWTAFEPLCLLLLVAAAFLIRLWGMTKMHFWDENVYLLNAGYFFNRHAGFMEIDQRPPLLPLLFAGVFHLWNSDYAAEIVTALLNALGPLFMFLAGRRIVGQSAAAIAALLLAFGPFFVGVCSDGSGGFALNCNGHSLLTDCPALTLALVSLWLGLRALEEPTVLRFLGFGFSLAMVVLMRFGSLSSVGILSLLALAPQRRVKASIAGAAGFVLGIGPYLCWSKLQYGGFLETLKRGWWNLGGNEEPFGYYLAILPQMISWLGLAGLALWLIRKGWELWGKRQPGDLPRMSSGIPGGSRLPWDLFLMFWAVAVLLFFSSLSHKEPRYAIPLAAPLLLLSGSGLSTLLMSGKNVLKKAGYALLAGALIVTVWPSHHRFDGGFIDRSVSNEMIVAQFLKDSLPSSTVLYANENYPDFAYYSGLTVIDLPEGGDDLYAALKDLSAGSVLIAYKASDDDEGSPVEPALSFLDSNPRFTRIREFPTLVIYRTTGP
ncbi:MAG: glycosyltransferase family 39 protein [Terracidiphilus sp.]|jgi:4-amino-4-deoxy-L-arabinose transferase-like glycosyltransferase